MTRGLEQVRIGRVPDRGGRVDDISGGVMFREVRRANEAMRGKDAGSGARGGRGGVKGGFGRGEGGVGKGGGVDVAAVAVVASGQYHPEYATNAPAARGAAGRGAAGRSARRGSAA